MFSITVILFLYLVSLSVSLEQEKKCRERTRLITTDNGDLYELVDATPNEKLILECDYCKETDDYRPKNWYKIDSLGMSRPHEVVLGMENDMELNRIQVNTQHSLIINNFSAPDAGLYYCVGFEKQEKEEKYNYLVDLVYEVNTTDFETGNISGWSKYHDDYFAPVNGMFRESKGAEFVHIRERLKLGFEAISQWDPWGICEVCGRPNNQGVRKKRGHCRIKITRNSRTNTTDKAEELYFTKANAVSCRSQRLFRSFPGISNLTRVIPDFVQQERCEGTCNPDAEGINRGWKVGKSKGFKYRKTFVLSEGAHLTLVCPESSLENTVTWKNRGKALTPGEAANPNLLVDTFNTLYLVDVTETEAGNYTCQVDDIKMQQVIVFVASKSRLLTQEFVRHLAYLGFVLSLTGTCYCAGLVVTYNRRRTFKTFEELIEDHPEDADDYEHLLKK